MIRSMKHQFYAIVSIDKSGPAYGVGTTEDEARQDAARWGFECGIAVPITCESYEAVLLGNPDAWEAI